MDKPIKSRHGLTRCGACRAHIHAAERPSATVCPFCGANLSSGRAILSLPTGRGGLLAASLFGLSMGGAMAGCGGSDATQADEPTTVDDGNANADDGSNANDGDDQYADDPPDDNNAVAEYGVAPSDEYETQPSDDYRPAARYGIAPSPR
jgi:hypothetical protein